MKTPRPYATGGMLPHNVMVIHADAEPETAARSIQRQEKELRAKAWTVAREIHNDLAHVSLDLAEAHALLSLPPGVRDTCETTHCIAGWGIHQAGPDGYRLEREVGPAAAGAILLGLDAAHHFHVTDANAREWLASKLEAA